jgi:KRAB domain-containing zinc finger protein
MYKNEQKKNDHEARRHGEVTENEKSDDLLLCNTCGQRFKHMAKLREHMMAKHVSKGTDQFVCKYCSMVYTHRRTYERHVRDKHEGGQNRCEQCGRCFTQPVYLERHRSTHKKEFLVCKTCGKQFSAAKQLQLHEFDHLGYRPYNCPELTADGVLCGFSAKKKAPFVFHLHKQHDIDYNENIHGMKNNIELAKKMFLEKTMVNEKVLTHGCKFCGKAFQTATGLLHHK